MPKRKTELITGNCYHIYNRGIEKRPIVSDSYDQLRFLRTIDIFNTSELVGSVFEHDFRVKSAAFGDPVTKDKDKLVEISAFNLLDNHYHVVLKQLVDGGIVKFMHNWIGGYARYFNEKYERSGPLFQGPFKVGIIDDEEHLEKIIAYVNLNHMVHGFGDPVTKWGIRSSWGQYTNMNPAVVTIKPWRKFDKKKTIEIVKEIIKERKEKREEKENENLVTRSPNKYHE